MPEGIDSMPVPPPERAGSSGGGTHSFFSCTVICAGREGVKWGGDTREGGRGKGGCDRGGGALDGDDHGE
eukprot:277368-Chlamydomonas_euryale.AAC.1